MEKINKEQPLVVITGPTASGKTSISIKLAKKYNGEIICADSRTIYRYMNIGTAKPSVDEMDGVIHWGLDLVNPGEYYSVADFKKYADEKIAEIRAKNKVPFLVGGSGLYIDSVIFDYKFGVPKNDKLRKEMSEKAIEELLNYCTENNIQLPTNSSNKRYLIRNIENSQKEQQIERVLLSNTIVVGVTTKKEELLKRIEARTEVMFSSGVTEEAEYIANKYGWESEAMKGNIYPIIHKLLKKEISIEQAKELMNISDRQLVKKQLTWMRRNQYIKWLGLDDAFSYLDDFLANRQEA